MKSQRDGRCGRCSRIHPSVARSRTTCRAPGRRVPRVGSASTLPKSPRSIWIVEDVDQMSADDWSSSHGRGHGTGPKAALKNRALPSASYMITASPSSSSTVCMVGASAPARFAPLRLLLLDDVGEVAMDREHAAAGQGPVGHLDGAAGHGAPPLGRLAGRVEARDAAFDPALQPAGQRPRAGRSRRAARGSGRCRRRSAASSATRPACRAGAPSPCSGRASVRRPRRAARRRSCCRARCASCPRRRPRRGAPCRASATGRRRRGRARSARARGGARCARTG